MDTIQVRIFEVTSVTTGDKWLVYSDDKENAESLAIIRAAAKQTVKNPGITTILNNIAIKARELDRSEIGSVVINAQGRVVVQLKGVEYVLFKDVPICIHSNILGE